MKGVVFTEFLELVHKKYGEEIMDLIIEASDLPSGAAYSSAGNYNHAELLTLVQTLSEAVRVPVSDLFKDFGQYLFTRFAVRYPQFLTGVTSSFEFFDRIESHVHVEVKKLHPDAELPLIEVEWLSDDRIHLIYSSTRPLAALAEGLMLGTITHFQERIAVRKLRASNDGTFFRFELARS